MQDIIDQLTQRPTFYVPNLILYSVYSKWANHTVYYRPSAYTGRRSRFCTAPRHISARFHIPAKIQKLAWYWLGIISSWFFPISSILKGLTLILWAVLSLLFPNLLRSCFLPRCGVVEKKTQSIVKSIKSVGTPRQIHKFRNFFYSLSHIELREPSDKRRLIFRINRACSPNHRRDSFCPSCV